LDLNVGLAETGLQNNSDTPICLILPNFSAPDSVLQELNAILFNVGHTNVPKDLL
jgi:hypothetical protein